MWKVLKMQVGQPFRAGVVDIGMTSAALILDSSADTNSIHDTKNITNEALISKSTLSSTTSSASSLSQTNTETMRISLGKRIDLQTVPKPPISLILAAPRPLRLERILPVASTLGVRHIAIIGAEKVQKDYLGIQMLQKPQLMRSMLVEGLEQVEVDYHLPTYSVHKSFNKFINFEIKSVDSPVDTPVTVTNTTDKVEIVRIITQPQFPIMIDTSVSGQVRTLPPSIRISELFKELFPSEITEKSEITGQHPRIHIIIAIGPEGGWTFDELNAFVIRGYRLVHFGDRILRTDTAVQFNFDII